ncbi:hypothetical protein GCM10011588_39230 [Nocardia jinanensis]|uniref:DUF8176 domain-containing protein n=3 Tax=Nocardia jinanensis TaxID=382504 RepID=A0A917VW85_9NOCA|nr:hypothetical protein GCM10011588_39230 [Nocardia jinanensis]
MRKESDEDRQIVLDEPTSTGMVDWLVSASTPNSADDGRWLTPPRRACTPGHLRAVLGGAVVAAFTASAMVVTTVVAGTDHAETPIDPPIRITDAPPSWPADGRDRSPIVTGSSTDCGPGTVEAETTLAGARPLRAMSGAWAIAVFEAAYYHARDAVMARDVVATEAAVSDATTIQAGIDSAPPVTGYCVRIRPLTPGLYAVEITETRPDTPPTVWRQRISTTRLDGNSVITAITSE